MIIEYIIFFFFFQFIEYINIIVHFESFVPYFSFVIMLLIKNYFTQINTRNLDFTWFFSSLYEINKKYLFHKDLNK